MNLIRKTEDTAHGDPGSRVLVPGKKEGNGFSTQCKWDKSADFNSSEEDLESPTLFLGRHNPQYNTFVFNTQTQRASSWAQLWQYEILYKEIFPHKYTSVLSELVFKNRFFFLPVRNQSPTF